MTAQPPRRPILTQHCRFCNHLLLATTRTLSALPRRSEGAQDKAIILPLGNNDAETEVKENENEALSHQQQGQDQDQDQQQTDHKTNPKPKTKHTTLLLSTTIPDRRPTLIRREDGIEKRVLLRCGRCRVVVGYYLDKVHWESTVKRKREVGGEEAEEEEGEERPPPVYVLPGAVVETGDMGGEGVGEREWRSWDV